MGQGMNQLESYIKREAFQPFKWGVCDCALFTAGWVKECTGFDPAERYRGTYDSPITANRIIHTVFGDMENMLNDYPTTQNPKVGDICLCVLDKKKTFGIMGHNRLVLFKSDNGVQAERATVLKSWRVC